MTSLVDTVIASRNLADSCNKVTLITHSSGANQALVAAADSSKKFSDKVAQIINLAPCLQVNIDNFWLPVKDEASIKAFYSALENFGITNMFGPDGLEQIQPFCNTPGVYMLMCNAYILPAMSN